MNNQFKEIALLENLIGKTVSLEKVGINATLFRAYFDSKDAENELIDIHDVIWDNEVEQITSNLKDFGVTEFTISCTFTGLLRTLTFFESFGYKTAGLTEVNTPYVDFFTDKRDTAPAIKLVLE